MNARPAIVRTAAAALAAGVLSAGVLAVAAPNAVGAATSAVAGKTVQGEKDLEKRGACGTDGRYDFEVDSDDGKLETDLDLDSAGAGEKWRVQLFHNGESYFDKMLTTDNEREIEVETVRPDAAGADTFRAEMANAAGETCTATLVRK